MLREVECDLDLLIIRDASLKRVRVLENPGEVIVVDGAERQLQFTINDKV